MSNFSHRPAPADPAAAPHAPPATGSRPPLRQSQEPDPSPGLARRAWPALLLLAAGLLATALVTRHTQSDVTAAARQEFDFSSQQISLKVAERLQAHEQILRSGAALFVAVETVSRAEWHTFVQSLQVEQRLPGIQGVGYSLLIPSERLAEHQQAIREEGFPNYRVRPEGERAVYSAIIYLEPFTNRNLRAFGYDMFSEPVRRAAMERARDENAAALSGKVLLVQETATDVQPGTLMYVPVYRHERPVATVEERRAALQGWIYSPYRMNDLMRGILGGWDSPTAKRIRLQVFDGEEPSPDGLLYDTQAADKPARRPASGLTLQTPIIFAGRDWTLLFTQGNLPASAAEYGRVWGVAGGGAALSLLLAGLLHSLLNTRFNARRLAGQLTSDLQSTTDRLELATAAGGVGIWDYDVVNNHLVWDDQMFRLYGITRTQFSGAYEAWTAGVHPEDRQRGDEEIQQGLRGEKRFDTEFRVLWPDGSIRHLQAQARVQRDAAGQPVRMLGTNWDITARKQAETALLESEENILLLLNSTAEAIYGIDLHGDCTFCNSSCLRLLGYQHPDELLGKNMHWQIHGKHADGSCFAVEECRIFQAFIKGEPSHVNDEVLWRADGSAFPAEYWSYPQRRNGMVIGAVVTFLDITERQRAEAELLRTLAAERELSALKSMVVNTVSHEFRTPLAAILGAAELLDDYYYRLTPEKRAGYFLLIRQETQRLAAMVQDVLVQGQLDAGSVRFQPRPTDVVALCREIVARVQAAFPKHPPVHFAADAPGSRTLADQSLLERVLNNLLTNALKYSPALTPVRVTVQRVAEEWEIQVQDQGLGIPKADQAHLFSAFRRGGNVGNIKGTGVGLYIVKQCAALHGGRIELRPQDGHGSTFVFAFPWRLAETNTTETP
jgi:PAS domain S-box-containing protein